MIQNYWAFKIQSDKVNFNASIRNKSDNIAISMSDLKLKLPLSKDTITFSSKQAQKSKSYLDKINVMPDFKQLNPNFPDGGEYYCGPVSSSNAIKYLSDNGYENLSCNLTQTELIKKLAKLYKTNKESGSNVVDVCKALDEYVTTNGYKAKRLEFQGFRPVQDKYRGKLAPDIEDLKKAIEKDSVVLLYLGIYKKPEYQNGKLNYKRIDGHWVTLAGYKFNDSKNASESLIVHDPMSFDTGKINNCYLNQLKLTSGTLIMPDNDTESTFPVDASGYNLITEGLDWIKPDEELAILDGALILELEK